MNIVHEKGRIVPKIIKDVEGKILETAQHLFSTEAYAGVDMRRIAKETGIATGTLYNYFSSKQDLLNAVFEHSWRVSLRRLEATLHEAGDREPPVERFIRLVYQEFQRNAHVARAHLQVMMPEHVKQISKNPGVPPEPIRRLLQDIMPLFQEAVRRQYDCRMNPQLLGKFNKILGALPLLILSTDAMNVETADENLRFLQDLVNGYFLKQFG